MGSENGTPSSIRSTPPRSSAATSSGVRSGDGSPAVRYAISALRFPPSALSNVDWIRLIKFVNDLSRTMFVSIELGKILAINVRVFVAAPGKIHQEQLALGRGRSLDRLRDGGRRFKRRN